MSAGDAPLPHRSAGSYDNAPAPSRTQGRCMVDQVAELHTFDRTKIIRYLPVEAADENKGAGIARRISPRQQLMFKKIRGPSRLLRQIFSHIAEHPEDRPKTVMGDIWVIVRHRLQRQAAVNYTQRQLLGLTPLRIAQGLTSDRHP